MPETPDRFELTDDLTQISDAYLTELHDRALAEFQRVQSLGVGNWNVSDITYSTELAESLDKIKAEQSAREVRAAAAAASAKLAAERRMADLNEQVNGPATGTPEADAVVHRTELEHDEAIAAAAARGTMTALVKAMGEKRGLDLTQTTERMVASLSATSRVAPKPKVAEARLSVTASATGQDLTSMEALAAAFTEKAQNIPITASGREATRHPVAKVHNQTPHTVDMRTSPYRVQEVWEDIVKEGAGNGAEALIAGGGWCAPSEIMYDFFNIAGMPRTIDLPTVGVSRGGVQFPVSPAIGDVFFTAGGSNPASGFGGFAFSFANTSDPWLWSETDDILTVTGSVNKPTLRVPCSSFSTQRLEAYGLTVTAGNLTDSAYPEQTQNFIRLLRAAYAHAINARLIGLMVTASGSTSGTIGAATAAAVPQVPNAAALAATDYRSRYAMDEDAVLEVVYPYWLLEAMRSDMGYRPGIDGPAMLAVVDAEIRGLYTSRNLRPQFVSDWQVRASGKPGAGTAITTFGTSVLFMVYAAGTFLHGTGMSLDLGVVRDSVLNSENDFTAAWAEETHLVAQVGHASRIYTANFQVGGNLAAQTNDSKV